MGKKSGLVRLSPLVGLLILVVFFLVVSNGLGGFLAQADGASLASMERAIQKAAVQCYALEGSYPPDLAYLEVHYGVILNREAYFYHYEVFASNMMPEIGVYKKWR